MSVNGKSTSASAPLLKNAATAPVVYFDGAPVHGTFGGNIEIELATRVLLPKVDGNVTVDMTCVAHLRCSRQAAKSLMAALDHALRMEASVNPHPDGDAVRLNS